jgi:hypothetical protein
MIPTVHVADRAGERNLRIRKVRAAARRGRVLPKYCRQGLVARYLNGITAMVDPRRHRIVTAYFGMPWPQWWQIDVIEEYR